MSEFMASGSKERASGASILSSQEWSQIGDELCLSPRELQIVRRVFDDHKELAIASQLGISRHTVHTYLERIYRKLEVKSRVQLVVHVMSEYLESNGHRNQDHGGGAEPAAISG